MIKLVAAFVLGIVVATVGLSGIVQIADSGIEVIKTQSQELSRTGQIPESRWAEIGWRQTQFVLQFAT